MVVIARAGEEAKRGEGGGDPLAYVYYWQMKKSNHRARARAVDENDLSEFAWEMRC